jgi:aminoglycoside phosphotransferase (APT) family kinase protein
LELEINLKKQIDLNKKSKLESINKMIDRQNIYYWKCDRESAFSGENKDKSKQEILEIEDSIQVVLSNYFRDKTSTIKSTNSQGNHMIYKVDHKNRKYFFRLESGSEGDSYMEIEANVLNKIRAIGIPAPIVYEFDSTRSKVSFAYQIMEFINYPDLNSLNKMNPINLLQIAEVIGEYMGKWQSIRFKGYGPFNIKTLRQTGKLVGLHRHYKDYFLMNFEKHLQFLTDNSFFVNSEAEQIRQVVKTNEKFLSLDEGCLVHKDIALWNILGDENTIRAVIDWDDTISGDPIDDISLLACFHSEDVILKVIKGYEKVKGKLPEDYLPRFWLHLLRNMIVKAVIRVGGDYFNKQDDFFLIDTGLNGASLYTITINKIHKAVEGLIDHKQIKNNLD